jgi:predicted N-acyltransferase
MAPLPPFDIRRHDSVLEIPVAHWNALAPDTPFMRHEFIAALEHAGCVGPGTAWRPAHLTLAGRDDELAAALPLYVKLDSQGEFVFDWGWADAYVRAGGRYYPKLVAAVPFTPATGQRILVHPQADRTSSGRRLVEAARALAEDRGLSSLHVLFPTTAEQDMLAAAGLTTRKGCQFHWHNDGYADFEDFLERFSSAKRKKIRRERRRIAEAGVEFEHLAGHALKSSDWDAVFGFYARTFLQRGRLPYLNRAFFEEVASTLSEQVVVILARLAGRPIASAICFRGDDTLYGRYWGSVQDFHSLHFETCYYQGIDYCIRQRLARFEPGTQGEHKIARGFAPTATWSSHWIRDPAFAAAVDDFLLRERLQVDAYMNELTKHLPYRQDAFRPRGS